MSDQPRRKYPRRAPAAGDPEPLKIDKLGDITDLQFTPNTIFFQAVKGSYVIMDEIGDKGVASRRRKSNNEHYGLQSQNSEGKKGSVKNWRPLAVTPVNGTAVPVDMYPPIWSQLNEACDAVFDGQNLKLPLEKLYNNVQVACVNKFEPEMFKDLTELFRHHIAKWMEKVETRASAMDDWEFLQFVEGQWQDLCRKIKLIRCIFLILDRTYCLQCADKPSIWDMGIAMCRDCIVGSNLTEKKLFDGLLKAVERERNGEQVDRALLKNVMRMLADLTLYETHFEELFIQATQTLYSVESRNFIQTHDIPEYLKYVNRRLMEEEHRIENYLQLSTRRRLIPTVEQELIQTHLSAMIAKGADLLIDDKRFEDMTLMYQLCSRTFNGLAELCRAFCEYIKKRGRVIVMDEGQDKNMIHDMLALKARTEEVFKQCFREDAAFKKAVREGFEHFINQRPNKPAEMIAKYVDSKLKMGNKETTEEELEQLMDRLLILFRYIHGKDVFEAFYKKDLAKRLLLGLSASVDSEKLMLQKLKTECGSAFTSRLEGMFRDIEMSKEQLGAYAEYASNPQKTNPVSGAITDFSVSVLTQGIWPHYTPCDVILPPNMNLYLEDYQKFYISTHSGRKLQWLHSLAQCTLKASYAKGAKFFQVSLPQSVVLLLFNDVNELSFSEIRVATNIETEELKRTMASLCTSRIKVLTKSGPPSTVSASDVFSYDENFWIKQTKVKINAIQAQETPEEGQKTQEGVFMDRQYQIDAAIVRIMKTRKALKHALLLAEIYKQLRFPVTPNDLKKRIESLIERDFMVRDKDDQAAYNYVA